MFTFIKNMTPFFQLFFYKRNKSLVPSLLLVTQEMSILRRRHVTVKMCFFLNSPHLDKRRGDDINILHGAPKRAKILYLPYNDSISFLGHEGT